MKEVRVDLFPELEVVYLWFKNVLVLCSLFEKEVEDEMNYQAKQSGVFRSKPVFVECDDLISAVKIGRCPMNMKTGSGVSCVDQFNFMVVVSLRSEMCLYFLGFENERKFALHRSTYSVPIPRTKSIHITQNGRVFVLDSSDEKVEELAFRDMQEEHFKANLVLKLKGLVKLTHTDLTCKRAREFSEDGIDVLYKGAKKFLKIIEKLYKSVSLQNCSIQVDETRNILYQLSTYKTASSSDRLHSLVRIYDLGEQSNDFCLISEIHGDFIMEEAFLTGRIPRSWQNQRNVIASISPVTLFDNDEIKLVVFMENGSRVFVGFDSRRVERIDSAYAGFYRHTDRPSNNWYIVYLLPPVKLNKADFERDRLFTPRTIGTDPVVLTDQEQSRFTGARQVCQRAVHRLKLLPQLPRNS